MKIPRPLGVTLMIRGGLIEKAISYIVRAYVAQDYSYQGERVSIPEFSRLTGIEVKTVIDEASKMMSSQGFVLDKKGLIDATRVIGNWALLGCLEDRHTALKQAQALVKSQGDTYKPFISSEVNRAISNQITTGKTLLEAYKMLATPDIVKELTAESQGDQAQYLTVEAAVGLLAQESLDNQELAQRLKASTAVEQLPNISGFASDGSDVTPDPANLIQIPDGVIDLKTRE